MIRAVAELLSGFVQRWLPDPLIFALALTAIVFVAGIGLTPHGSAEMIGIWGAGFWNLLAFAMQMVLVLVTGHALASSPAASRLMRWVASRAHTPGQAVVLVTLTGALGSLVNWGFGLVLGAMFAREVARRVKGCDYGLLVASAYIGFMTWHGGFSGSVPLMAATKGNPMEASIGLIPVTDTLLARFNLGITAALLIALPLITWAMTPKPEQARSIDPALLKEEGLPGRALEPGAVPARRLEENPILSWLAALLIVAYLVLGWLGGFKLDINTVNFILLAVGLVLHGSPMAYARAIAAGAKETGGIILQYPFYAGIQAMLDKSGLGGMLTNAFVAVADRDTFPLLAFLSSGVINFAVPSGGGHWVVQAPFVMPAAQALGADLGKAAMAIAYGEAWMNMAQPFWALPALSIAGLGVRDIMGYCVTALLFTLPIFLLGLYLL
ncbi:MAG TPA: TIGR00366 family protein [Stellaceae bacterium]|nr:TIGR00366 family protein [Stellaceae bacterium]